MNYLLKSERIILRAFEPNDLNDFLELSKNWKNQPGPDWDKWPVDENGGREIVTFFGNQPINETARLGNPNHQWCAIYCRNENKVIGLLGINPSSDDFFLQNKMIDLGHVIHSDYQNNDIDREAIGLLVEFIFQTMPDVNSIITNNDPNEKQNAPLFSLGFVNRNESGGELILERSNLIKL